MKVDATDAPQNNRSAMNRSGYVILAESEQWGRRNDQITTIVWDGTGHNNSRVAVCLQSINTTKISFVDLGGSPTLLHLLLHSLSRPAISRSTCTSSPNLTHFTALKPSSLACVKRAVVKRVAGSQAHTSFPSPTTNSTSVERLASTPTPLAALGTKSGRAPSSRLPPATQVGNNGFSSDPQFSGRDSGFFWHQREPSSLPPPSTLLPRPFGFQHRPHLQPFAVHPRGNKAEVARLQVV